MKKLTKKQIIILSIILVIMIAGLSVLIWFKSNKTTNNSTNITSNYTTEDEDDSWDKLTASYITFKDNKIVFEGSGASVSGNTITITSSGEYAISGTIDDVQIVVDVSKNDTVKLILNGTEMTSKTSSVINVKNAKKTIVVVEKDTENKISDTTNSDENDEANSTIYSDDDLTINGKGKLYVVSSYNDAIATKDDLKIINSNIEIESVDEGLRGKDSINIKNATIKIKSSGDGIKTTNETDTDKGNIVIEGGNIDITSTTDGIQATNTVKIVDATISINSGGGSENSSTTNDNWGMWGKSNTTQEDTTSAKGIKAVKNITIESGTFNLDTSDDSIHSNGTITINNGEFKISSGDDGIHADSEITINNGTINISKSYEGIESALITINDGKIYVTASDDGINVGGGNDNSAMNRPGENTTSDNGRKLTINGGYIYVDSKGDGLDSNGSMYMNGGTVIVNGPTDNGNGALDYDSEFVVNGGLLIAAGSSGMLQTPSNSSSLYTLSIGTNGSAGNIIHIEDSDGNEIITFAPSKTYQSVVITSSDIKNGKTYNVYTGGSYSTEATDGLYTNGTYTGGTKLGSATISNNTTQVGNVSNGGMGGMMQGQSGQQRRR